MKAIILCAGKGTRLRPLTYTSAKHLIPLANKPALYYGIEKIKACGIDKIGIIIGKETGEDIKKGIGTGEKWGVVIDYILQEEPLGLAHAVKVAREYLQEESFLMFLGDNLLKNDIKEYRNKFERGNSNAFVLLTHVENPQQFGIAVLKNNKIVKLTEKPKDPPSDLALIGVYFFDKNIHKAIENIHPSNRGELEITDAVQWLIDNKYNVEAEVIDGWWKDTGKPEDIIEANRLILEDIHRDMNNADIDEKSKIFGRVKLGENVKITNSTILGPVAIGNDVIITNSYIGPFTSLSNSVIVENSEIEYSIVMYNTIINNIESRMQNCLIGKDVHIYSSNEMPRAYKFILADDSKVRLI
ncbi:MAG: glucose-1-phosphate thymidylyltransferase [Atribacterota bacterium]|nr:glucose-1-phosphate thymidylyltransferase [Atribacterota bacterium]